MNELAGRRAAAYAYDCIGYAAIAGCTVPLGLLAHAAGWGSKRSFVLAASAVPPIAATLLAARREAGVGATWGKRRYGLTVTDRHGSVPGFGRSLLRPRPLTRCSRRWLPASSSARDGRCTTGWPKPR